MDSDVFERLLSAKSGQFGVSASGRLSDDTIRLAPEAKHLQTHRRLWNCDYFKYVRCGLRVRLKFAVALTHA
jgi:hypothetical protein